MLGIGDRLPELEVTVQNGCDEHNDVQTMALGGERDRWTVLLFWPRDFTSVCPTEVIAFGELTQAFIESGADLIGASTDSATVHLAWRRSDPRLGRCAFPWIADERHILSDALGIYNPAENMARRVTFIVDPSGVIQHVTANANNVGRSSVETLRVLAALQTEEECPCDWEPAAAVLNG